MSLKDMTVLTPNPINLLRLKGSDVLGRYYTCDEVSDFLIEQMGTFAPAGVIDLGSGGGALSLAAMAKWQEAQFVTVDVDEYAQVRLGVAVRELSSVLRHRHVSADALRTDLPDILLSPDAQIDAGVCNPPFITPKWKADYGAILEDAGLSCCLPILSSVDAAALFLAQNLRILRDGGKLGIILPDTLVSSIKYKKFRQQILSSYCVEKAIRLPRRSFMATDALAHILIINKKPSDENIQLYRLNDSHKLSECLSVSKDQAAERLDYDFHVNGVMAECVNIRSNNTIPLGDIVIELKRGRHSSSDVRQSPFPIFHTTDIESKHFGKWISLRQYCSKANNQDGTSSKLITASPGDILISRVGRNLEGKILGISYGYPVISDCIFRLRVPRKYRQNVLDQLTSRRGIDWIAAHSYGVGARQLSKSDLLTFPLCF